MSRPEPHPIVVMGVSGSGKSTVGKALAAQLGRRFVDADDLHAAESREKMAAGIPLTDADRLPWLETVGRVLADAAPVVACSALRRSYRDLLRSHAPETFFVELDAPRAVLAERMNRRHGHFMPESLLASQLATLEPLGPDERGGRFDATEAIGVLTDAVERALGGASDSL